MEDGPVGVMIIKHAQEVVVVVYSIGPDNASALGSVEKNLQFVSTHIIIILNI